MTALAGVIGWPVAHSRSPLLHNAWLTRHGIDGIYLALPVAPGDFVTAVHGLRAAGFRGVNVTVPHKEAAFAVCDHLDDSARAAGAVNTLVFAADGIHGSNSDGAGFIANLRAHGVDPCAGPALLLGAGGAARAIAAALLAGGVPVTIANRSAGRAEALVAALAGAYAPGAGGDDRDGGTANLRVLGWSDRHAAVADHALLVNTTSAGLHGAHPLDIDLAGAAATLAVADIVYVPLFTPLLQDARARGLRIVPGLGMLLHQAVPGFAAWFGQTPVVDEEITRLLAGDIPPA